MEIPTRTKLQKLTTHDSAKCCTPLLKVDFDTLNCQERVSFLHTLSPLEKKYAVIKWLQICFSGSNIKVHCACPSYHSALLYEQVFFKIPCNYAITLVIVTQKNLTFLPYNVILLHLHGF